MSEDAVAVAPATGPVGIDAGITRLLTLPTGEKTAKARRELSRKTQGSANRAGARRGTTRVCACVTDLRKGFLHKLTTRLVRKSQVAVIEDMAAHADHLGAQHLQLVPAFQEAAVERFPGGVDPGGGGERPWRR